MGHNDKWEYQVKYTFIFKKGRNVCNKTEDKTMTLHRKGDLAGTDNSFCMMRKNEFEFFKS